MKRFLFVVLSVSVLVIAGSGQDKQTGSVKLFVSGMHCENCVAKVEKALKGVDGVGGAEVSLKENTASVLFASNAKVSHDALLKAVADAGYEASLTKPDTAKIVNKGDRHNENEQCDDKKEGEDCCKVKEGKDQHKSEMKKEEKKN